ncbi:MAG: flagellar motor stator protein MotA [Sphingomonadales bacterium]
MLVIVGIVVMLICVFGGFTLAGGKFDIILYALPYEMMIIMGGAIGALMMANGPVVLKKSLKGVVRTLKGPKWKKDDYRDLLCLMFVLMKMVRTKGVVAVEAHIERPEESKIFQHFSRISADHHIVELIADYLRMMTMNFEDPHQVEDAMEKDLEGHHAEEHEAQHALQIMADGLPAIGIVAAVLGVIKTMGNITAPTEVLGASVGGALVGTFLGILLSYLLVGPIAGRLAQIIEEEGRFTNLIKLILVSHLHGNAPQISVEIGRRNTPSVFQPGFLELEEAIAELPPDL